MSYGFSSPQRVHDDLDEFLDKYAALMKEAHGFVGRVRGLELDDAAQGMFGFADIMEMQFPVLCGVVTEVRKSAGREGMP